MAIKLFSVMPSSMADERTMSTFTWLNSALRNRQLVETVVDMAQVREWYRKEREVPYAPVFLVA